ncbi:MAG: nucleoside triphosphate pyrophosphohydrolase [Desulfotignum sp.]|nr:nucleoside triphosphate pyrophosphohydrolase [Desulfotignum sp.]MCF8112371.1 nucleoside triphosphate pyrophosphohydrolase [Desulfotignum sp.]MCF8125171.1 nucleoside triphosphate pyrophosphohydrolase [Desulfotignum sp.]
METLAPVLDVIQTLRGKNGCEWDRRQTPVTMWKCLAQEVYELQEALVNHDLDNTCEEMGDVLFQILFIMEIFHETGQIPISRVVDTVVEKMIRRHPHVYENAVVKTQSDLLDQWERIKTLEKTGSARSSAMDAVPRGMPGLLRAMKVSRSAVKQGFEWENIHQVLDTVKSEISEFEAALEKGDEDGAMLEFGDIVFSLVNVARFAGFHPETALARATAKFEGRFRVMEAELIKQNMTLEGMSAEQKERFWSRAKQAHDQD